MNLEELLNVKVKSVSKKEEKLQNVASSIYIITNEDISNSGATTLYELLRSVPGYWSTQTEYNVTAPNIRNNPPRDSYLTGSVLYLLDGTPIQELMNSTVNLINLDLPLDEIDKIEIIKGSGGVVYGANSTTGVVNIFTKSPDQYDGINVRTDAAYPGYGMTSLRAGGKINEKLALSGYGKLRYFEGYGTLDEFDGEFVTVPKSDGSGDTTIKNHYTKNFEKSTMISTGLKSTYQINSETKLSLNLHFNTVEKGHYSHYYTPESFYEENVKIYNQISSKRLTGSIKVQHHFTDDHSVFFRTSSNYENLFERFAGGYRTSNSILDFEIQDNFNIKRRHKISIGANLRLIHFDINSINDKATIQYIAPENPEMLTAFFAQDAYSLLKGKLDIIGGAKVENYSTVNNKYYISPMLKFSYHPSKKITLWGGFTQSYTTPGLNQTNIDYKLFSAPSYDFFYVQALQNGASESEADFFASEQAQNYPEHYNISVKNGSETKPSKYQSFEFGLRYLLHKKIYFESNLFFSALSDIVASSEEPIELAQPSPTRPHEVADYYLFGNYVKGNHLGSENIIKYIFSKSLFLEVSHSFLITDYKYQENPDFSLDGIKPSNINRNEDPDKNISKIPRQAIRLKSHYSFLSKYSLSISLIYTTKTRTQADYDYEKQRYISILGGAATQIAPDASRIILDLKLQRHFFNKKLILSVFANDLTNQGFIAQTSILQDVTLSKIGAMYGVGLNYKFK